MMSAITNSQKECLKLLKSTPTFAFPGNKARSLNVLFEKGMIENLKSSSVFDPVRNYSRAVYTATLTPLGITTANSKGKRKRKIK